MKSQIVLLRFSAESLERPVISNLVKKFDLEVNILRAKIHPTEEGRMLAKISGSYESLCTGMKTLTSSGVTIEPIEGSFLWDKDICVQCGACAGLCPSGAFVIDPVTLEVSFNLSECIMCERCIETCYYGAIQSIDDYIDSEGSLK